jgi:hypothetical protein
MDAMGYLQKSESNWTKIRDKAPNKLQCSGVRRKRRRGPIPAKALDLFSAPTFFLRCQSYLDETRMVMVASAMITC